MKRFALAGMILGIASMASAAPTVTSYQTSLGSPDGSINGNVMAGGSAGTVIAAVDSAVAGTLASKTVFTYQEASVWGTGGIYGGEVYTFNVISGLTKGDLLEVRKHIEYKDQSAADWEQYADWTYYFPLDTYTQTIGTQGNTYLTQIRVDGNDATFITGSALANDLTPDGSANNPPSTINGIAPWEIRQTLEVAVISGDWVLTGATQHARGYIYGTGYDVKDLGEGQIGLFSWDAVGDGVYVTQASIVPEPATMTLLALGGLALIRRRNRK